MPIAVCENQNIMASGTDIGCIDLWSTKNGQLLLKLVEHTQSIQCLDFCPTHTILASGSMDKTINLWNIESGVLIKKLEGHNKGVITIAFSEGGLFIASGGLDFKIIIWNLENHQIYKEFGGYSSEIVTVSFSPNGQIFAFAELNGLIHLWDTQSREFIQTKQFESKFVWVKFKTNNELLILTKSEIIQLDINSSALQAVLAMENFNITAALYFRKSEILIVYGLKYVRMYDLIQKKVFYKDQEIKRTIITYIFNQSKKINTFQFSQINIQVYQSMFAVKDSHNTVTISNIQQKDSKLKIKNYKEFPIAYCLSNDSNILAVSNWNKYLQLGSVQKQSLISSTNILDTQINHLKFFKKGDLLACRTFEKIIILFNQNLFEVNRLELPDIRKIPPNYQCSQNNLDYFDFSEDNQYIVFHQRNKFAVIWDINAQNCCCNVSMKSMSCFSFSLWQNLQQFESTSSMKSKISTNSGKSLSVQENVLYNPKN